MQNKQTPFKQRPILFSTEMVRAILEGRKTMTRRILKVEVDARGLRWCNPKTGWEDWHGNPVRCPYGKLGDILWVRENFYEYGSWQRRHNPKKGRIEWYFAGKGQYAYLGDPLESIVEKKRVYDKLGWYKRSSLFMPKEAARLFLRITDIRVECLQDISEEDAIAEGIQPLLMSGAQKVELGQLYLDYSKKTELFNDGVHPEHSFYTLWESINGAGSYDSNPWVWVVSFERILAKPS